VGNIFLQEALETERESRERDWLNLCKRNEFW